MRKLLVLLTLAAAAVALTMVAAAGTAVADKPKDGNTGKPSNPPCDADHGHPADNAKKCQDDGKDGKDGNGKKDTCNDGIDNDKDDKTDKDDPECQDPKDGIEDGSDRKDGVEPAPQCSDGIDNDEDEVADEEDPSCHTDGDAANPESYSPDHDTEFDCTSGPVEPDGHEQTNYGQLTDPLHRELFHALPGPLPVLGHDVLCGVNRLTGGAA